MGSYYAQRTTITFFVDLVHGGKVVHILEVDVDLYDFLPRRSSGLEDVTQVLDTLFLCVIRSEIGAEPR